MRVARRCRTHGLRDRGGEPVTMAISGHRGPGFDGLCKAAARREFDIIMELSVMSCSEQSDGFTALDALGMTITY